MISHSQLAPKIEQWMSGRPNTEVTFNELAGYVITLNIRPHAPVVTCAVNLLMRNKRICMTDTGFALIEEQKPAEA